MEGGQIEQPKDSQAGCIALLVIAAGVFLLSQCDGGSSSGTEPAQLAVSNLHSEAAEAGPTPLPPPRVVAQAESDLKFGQSAFAKAAAVDDATAAVIYSKNCYAALEASFSWAKLDRCGTFDVMAAQNVLNGTLIGASAEVDYFDSETAAGRYLSSGINHGAMAAVMDARWAAIDSYAQRVVEAEFAAKQASRDASEATGSVEINDPWSEKSETTPEAELDKTS